MKLVQPIAHGLYHTISRHWLLMPLGVDTQTDAQTHMHTNVRTKAISRNQAFGRACLVQVLWLLKFLQKKFWCSHLHVRSAID